MSLLPSTHGSALRIGLFVLMLLSVVVRPMVIQLGELHTFEHDIAAVSDHGHSHGTGTGDNIDSKHASGVHGLLHQADVSFAGQLYAPHLSVAALPLTADALGLGLQGVPSGYPASPFRPPIA